MGCEGVLFKQTCFPDHEYRRFRTLGGEDQIMNMHIYVLYSSKMIHKIPRGRDQTEYDDCQICLTSQEGTILQQIKSLLFLKKTTKKKRYFRATNLKKEY